MFCIKKTFRLLFFPISKHFQEALGNLQERKRIAIVSLFLENFYYTFLQKKNLIIFFR